MSRKRRKRRKNTTRRVLVWTLVLALVAGIAVAAVIWLDRSRRPAWDGGYGVRISEVMTDNINCPDPGGVLCDWVEIENTGDSAFSLTGYYLSDKAGEGKYPFPAGTIVPARGYLVVWCSSTEEGDYAPFALRSEGGESVYLMNSNRVAVDQAATVPCAAGQSLIRNGDGSLIPSDTPTPGYANDAAGAQAWQTALSGMGGDGLELSEIMSSNTAFAAPDGGYYDWVEIRNVAGEPVSLGGYKLSDREGKGKYEFPADVTLAPGETWLVWCVAGGSGTDMAPFALSSDGGETVFLIGPNGATADQVELPALEKNTSLARTATGWQATDQPTPGYSNDGEGRAALLSKASYETADIRITEIQYDNKGFCVDADGDFSDWIELTNQGAEPVDLAGWYLSDDPADPGKWQFPSLRLESGACVRLWASGKGRQGADGIHTGFSLSEGETVILSTPAGTTHRTAVAAGAEEGASLVLLADGRYVSCDTPTPGMANTAENYVRFCETDTRTSPLLLWEVAVYDPDHEDWVELKNVSDQPLELSGYTLTDKKSEPTRMRLPAGTLAPGESTVVEIRGFGLSAHREAVYLFDGAGRACDWAFLRGIPVPGTYGRQEGENGFFYFTSLTPGQPNPMGWRMVASAPVADTAPGVYREADRLTVTLTGESVYYTTDGSTPSAASTPYTGPIEITETTILRAASLPAGALGSDTLTLSYFLREESTLPVVSLVTDRENLFGPKGIYDHHEEAWAGDWERLANVSFFEEDGSFSIDCGIQMHGRTSRRVSDKRSFKLTFRGRYDGELNYDVFGDGLVTEFSSLLLRASVEDIYTSYMRDELFARLAMDNTTVLAQNYRYVTLYINGEYWGIYAIREHHSDNYFASHTGVDADTVEIQTGEFRRPGGWSDLMSYAEYNDLSAPAAWDYIQQHLDVPEMIDWLILECWSGDIDVYENVRFYGSPDYNGGRYMYGLVDMDLTMMNHVNTYGVGFNNVGQLHGIIPVALLRNGEFRDMFLTRLGELLQGGLSTQSVLDQIAELEAIVAPETARDLARWQRDPGTFAMQMEHLRNFTAIRNDEMISSAQAYFGLNQEQMTRYFGTLAG